LCLSKLKRQKQLIALSAFCFNTVKFVDHDNYTDCNECLDHLREIRIPPEELFAECKFNNQVINCTAAFSELVRATSLCYTFNGFEIRRQHVENISNPPQEWSIDEGYKPTASFDSYPRRALGAGQQFGLSVLLKYNKDDFRYLCDRKPGFWVQWLPMISDCI
jgi:hypothetical protein